MTSTAPLFASTRTFAALGVGMATLIVGAAGGVGAPPSVEPLAARSTPKGATLFTALTPAETGIFVDNRYADPAMWAERYTEATVGAVGTGVAIGDVDGDARPDVLIASKVETCRLFRNLGGFRFEDITVRAGVEDRSGAWKQGVAFADVENDGDLDLFICRSGAPSQLFINRGDGFFSEEAGVRGITESNGACMAAFADFDRNGTLDLYVLTNVGPDGHPEGEPDRLYRNRGDGTFVDISAEAGISGRAKGHSATWWDYDGDGWQDLYIANDFAPADRLYRNNGDGSFTDVINHALPRFPFSSMGADVADVNNDGFDDLLVADMAATTLLKDRRGAADARGRTHEGRTGADEALQVQHNTLFLGTGTSRCQEGAFLAGLAATDWTWSVRFEDFDNDGWVDLHVTNGMNREQHNTDLIVRMMTADTPAQRMMQLRRSRVLSESNLAFRNRGDLQFTPVGEAWGLAEDGVSFGCATGDLDGDGDLDLVYTNYQAGPSILRNDSATGARLVVVLRGEQSNRYGIGAQILVTTASQTQRRVMSVARGYASSSEPLAHFGLGDSDRVTDLEVRWPNGRISKLNDLPTNIRLTINENDAAALGDRGQSHEQPRRASRSLFESGIDLPEPLKNERAEKDATLPQSLLPFRHHQRGPYVAVADLTGDGLADILLGGKELGSLKMAARGPGSTWEIHTVDTNPEPGTVDGPIVVFDANEDGALDLLVTRGGANWPEGSRAYQPVLMINHGQGKLTPAKAGTLPEYTSSVGAVVPADFDGDGRIDLFIGGRVSAGRYPESPRSALWKNEGGSFRDVTEHLGPGLAEAGMITAASAVDLDKDGWMDLVLAVDWGTVQLWRNEQGRRFTNCSETVGLDAAGTGWWTSLAIGDFNADGVPDIAVGNAGSNTPYRADYDKPAVLLAGDFRKDGTEPQLIEAVYVGDRLFPRASRRMFATVSPALVRRLRTNDEFAAASVDQIVPADLLTSATRLTVTQLKSGVFLSRSGGQYDFAPFPRIAQIAPAQAILARDFDEDGDLDLLIGHNASHPAASVGAFKGGLGQLLEGDGRGGFRPSTVQESGISLPAETTALVSADLEGDGRAEILVARAGLTPLVLRTASEQRPPLGLKQNR